MFLFCHQRLNRWCWSFGYLLIVISSHAWAYTTSDGGLEPIGPLLNEQILRVNIGQTTPLELQVTVFKPPGNGPFPALIINHGKAEGNAKEQARARYYSVAREFVRRGYAVVLPMRRGFAGSDGTYVSSGCQLLNSIVSQANDVVGITRWMTQNPMFDATRMVMFGQSYGGVTSLGVAALDPKAIKLVVNFAGGLKVISPSRPCDWQTGLVDAMPPLANRAKIPTLWFYGDNDSYFPPDLARLMAESYRQSGGQVELVQYPAFKEDSHKMFGDIDGWSIWLNKTLTTMKSIGLPTEVRYVTGTVSSPPPSFFAPISSIEQLPFVREKGRKGYAKFLERQPPRAFALSPSGAWGWASGGDEAISDAIHNCQQNSPTPCKLYAFDDVVVWSEDTP